MINPSAAVGAIFHKPCNQNSISNTDRWSCSSAMAPEERDPIFFEVAEHAECVPDVQELHEETKDGIGSSLLAWLGGGWLQSQAARVSRPLLVSSSGGYVAVLHGMNVTILSKVDKFREPVGTFSGQLKNEEFLVGSWIAGLDIIVVVSGHNHVYILTATANMIKDISIPGKRAASAVDMFVRMVSDTPVMDKKYEVMVLTSDCTLYRIILEQRNLTVESTANTAEKCWNFKQQHLYGVSSLSFCPQKSILTIAGLPKVDSKKSLITGPSSLSLWNLSGFLGKFVLVDCSNVEHTSLLNKTTRKFLPKVIISPDGQYLALLDSAGILHLAELKPQSLSWVPLNLGDISSENSHKYKIDLSWEKNKRYDVGTCLGHNDIRRDLKDISWWGNRALTLAYEDGCVSVISVPNLNALSQQSLMFAFSDIYISNEISGHVFLLQHFEHNYSEDKRLYSSRSGPEKGFLSISADKLGWRMISLVERSLPQMYRILLDGGSYETALNFASKYNLDADDVYKSQWQKSDFGAAAIQQYLQSVKDAKWIISECAARIGPSAEAMSSLLSYGLIETEQHLKGLQMNVLDNDKLWFLLKRLRLLQYKDRLDTFLGMHLGRYMEKEYMVFRSTDLEKVAMGFAEGGRIGALSLLFKRHVYTLAPSILKVLDAIPETISPNKYAALLPEASLLEVSPLRRNKDFTENLRILERVKNPRHFDEEDKGEVNFHLCTEYLAKESQGLIWPSEEVIQHWYCERARAVDKVCGQIENSLALLDLGLQKGIQGLRHMWQEISDLYKVASVSEIGAVELSLSEWEKLSPYEKFKKMLLGVTENDVLDRLMEFGVPFMQRHGFEAGSSEHFLTKWLKELGKGGNLDICAAVFEYACDDPYRPLFFKDDLQIVAAGLACVYDCTQVDQWTLMKAILSYLPRENDSHGNVRYAIKQQVDDKVTMLSTEPWAGDCEIGKLQSWVQKFEGYVFAGQLLFQYQVPKPINFFLECQQDINTIKQHIRLLLSKFSRRQPGRSDNDWSILWHDLQILQEKAFPVLDTEFLLLELCRGLLKSEKFGLVKAYLKGNGSTIWGTAKAENLIIQSAKEYFYSASSLDSAEIEKAKQCLGLLPETAASKVESDLISAVTINLPKLGVNLFPMQFRQINDRIDIIKMALAAQRGVDLPVDQLMELAMLLGLTSTDDIALVEAEIAREAAACGNLEVACKLCLSLAEKGHGPVWDLCAAIGRGPEFEGIDLHSRKKLLGFSLCHCDDESVGELLSAWKEYDLLDQCLKLGECSGSYVVNLTDQDVLLASLSAAGIPSNMICDDNSYRAEDYPGHESEFKILEAGKHALSHVTQYGLRKVQRSKLQKELVAFACLQLPWLLKLSSNDSFYVRNYVEQTGSVKLESSAYLVSKECRSLKAQATALVLYGLTNYQIASSDDLIAKLTHENMEDPSNKDDCLFGCGYLLNFSDSHAAAAVLQQECANEKNLTETAIRYSLLHEQSKTLKEVRKRRELLYSVLRGNPISLADQISLNEDGFWRDWRENLEEKLHLNQRTKTLQELIPGIELERFVAHDIEYINSKVTGVLDSANFGDEIFEDQTSYQAANLQQLARLVAEAVSFLPGSSPNNIPTPIGFVNSFVMNVLASGINVGINEKYQEQQLLAEHTKISLQDLKTRYDICRPYICYLSNINLEDFLWKFLEISISAVKRDLPNSSTNMDTGEGQAHTMALSLLLPLWTTVFNDLNEAFEKQDFGSRDLYYLLKEAILCNSAVEQLVGRNLISGQHGLDMLITVIEQEGTLHLVSIKVFIKEMVTTGCPLKAILWLLKCYMSSSDMKEIPNADIEISTGSAGEDNGLECTKITALLVNIYNEILEVTTRAVQSDLEFHVGLRPIIGLLVSLSNDVDNMETLDAHEQQVLHRLRSEVWKWLCTAAEDVNNHPQFRICIFELLHAISKEDIPDIYARSCSWNRISWASSNTSGHNSLFRLSNLAANAGFDFKNSEISLNALKSTKIISRCWVDREIKAEDLATYDAAVSCFTLLLESVTTIEQFMCVISLLDLWGQILDVKEIDQKETIGTWPEQETWDLGWQEDDCTGENDLSPSTAQPGIHVFHPCWKMTLMKLFHSGCLEEALHVLDRKLWLSDGIVLLTEEETEDLVATIGQVDAMFALKVALLLPYTSARSSALVSVARLEAEGTSIDIAYMALVLLEGDLKSLLSDAKCKNIVSVLFVTLGALVEQAHLTSSASAEEGTCPLLSIIGFPLFVAELTKAQEYCLAAALVFQHMRVPHAFSTWNSGHVALKRYLESQLQLLDSKPLIIDSAIQYYGQLSYLPSTLNRLINQRRLTLGSALSVLSRELK